jgi:hypothetical protein
MRAKNLRCRTLRRRRVFARPVEAAAYVIAEVLRALYFPSHTIMSVAEITWFYHLFDQGTRPYI